MKYFTIENLEIDPKVLESSVKSIDDWEYYGTGRASLGISRWKNLDTSVVKDMR